MSQSRKNRAPSPLGGRVESALCLPAGTISGVAHIEAFGDRTVVVEGVSGILVYEPALIRLQTRGGVVRAEGENMSVADYTDGGIVITGDIRLLVLKEDRYAGG